MKKICRKVVPGEKRGRKIGFPTLNFPLKKGDRIKKGVWIVKIKTQKGKEYFGMANVGRAKTFEEKKERIEVHLLDFHDKSLNENFGEVEIYFLKYLRATKKFKKIEDLKEQIKKDIKKTRAFLKMKK